MAKPVQRRGFLRRQALQEQLTAAAIELVRDLGSEMFQVELECNDGNTYYLVFGQASNVRRMAGSLPDEGDSLAVAPGPMASTSIH